MQRTTAPYDVYAKIRDARGITDYAVAKAAEVSTVTMTNWKQNVYTPKIDKLIRIAQALDTPLDSLLVTTEVRE